MPQNWFVLYSHPNKENFLFKQLENHGITVYYPRIPAYPVNPRAHKMKPYFPGYMFVQLYSIEQETAIFRWMPYSKGLLNIGGEPAIVEDAFITLLRKHVNNIISSGGEIIQKMKSGDPIIINAGPFSQYSGIFDYRIEGSERVRVLLKMINDRWIPIELDSSQIQ
jgi:transcription antitermination factor NusG